MSLTWENARWADGPAVCDWLAQYGINPALYGDVYYRAWFRWGRGGKIQFFTLDKLLCRAGFHVSELPPEVWAADGRPYWRDLPECGVLRTRLSKGRCHRPVAPGYDTCLMHRSCEPVSVVAA